MNEENFYILIIRSDLNKRTTVKSFLLLKSIYSFLKTVDGQLLVNAQDIIKERGDTILWGRTLELRMYNHVETDVIAFENLESAELAFECID